MTSDSQVPENGYVSHLDEQGLEGARISIVWDFFRLRDESLGLEAEAEVVTEVVNDAIEEMTAAGATIVDSVAVADTASLEGAPHSPRHLLVELPTLRR